MLNTDSQIKSNFEYIPDLASVIQVQDLPSGIICNKYSTGVIDE
jgi:hypothetical protein